MASESILPPGHEWTPVYLPTFPEVGDGLYGFKTTIQVRCFNDVGKKVLEPLNVSLDIFLADPSSWDVYAEAIPNVRLGLLDRMAPLRAALEKAGYDAGGLSPDGTRAEPHLL